MIRTPGWGLRLELRALKQLAFLPSLSAVLLISAVCQAYPGGSDCVAVTSLPTNAVSPHYVGNRYPLVPAPLLKLPIGSIRPKGWLLGQLRLESEGMIGRLEEISKWCKFESSAWATADGQGKYGWEELPYWLKGYGDLGYVLNDPEIINHARKWIDATLTSQESSGFFGPRANMTSLEGQPDLWPHMVMLNVLQSFYEFTGDSRVLPFMTRYLQWLNRQPPETFGRGYWPKLRFGDTIESAHWLYNRTGAPFLLELATKIHSNMARWDTGVIDWHNVNIAQGFRTPGIYFVQAKDPRLLDAVERNYQQVMGLYGQFPGGGFAGDENCRTGYYDPRQGFETCGIVEFMHSFELLTKISGNPLWADRCEELAFNSLPAALTPDSKALHYLTAANQVQLDTKNKAPAIQNGGNMFAYSPYEVYRCCQHNVSHGWPYYAEELWLATTDRGLCASLYAASEVRAKVADGVIVHITEETGYPFEDIVNLNISLAQPATFPLYFRVPGWCKSPSVEVNGKKAPVRASPLSFVKIQREWKQGDRIVLRLPMEVSVRRWEKNSNAASVDYGPLTFSVKIDERWSKYGGSDAWPEYEVFPNSAWNYALEFNARRPAKSFKVIRRQAGSLQQPFTPENVPLIIEARARKIPEWKQDQFGLVGKLQPSPVQTTSPLETITLIPMGAARLRITSFPVVGSGKTAQTWKEFKLPPVSASHCFESDTVEALIDRLEPGSSGDRSIPRFTWWDHKGTTEWVQHDFPKTREVSSVSVYWFDDSATGGHCRAPKSWRVLCLREGAWAPVEGASVSGAALNTYNRVTFKPTLTKAVRLEVQLQPELSSGILEWIVGGE